MLGLIATLKVQSGKAGEFESAFQRMAEQVRANEPGCLLYSLHKTDEADTYVVMEQYSDQAALDAHRKTEHMRALGAEVAPLMAGAPDIKIYPAV